MSKVVKRKEKKRLEFLLECRESDRDVRVTGECHSDNWAVTYSIAQQDHPCCCTQLAEHRCSKAEFVFYKISTWAHDCLCHTFKCWMNLFSFNICPWGQKGLNNDSPLPAWVVFLTLLGKMGRHRAVLVWSTPGRLCLRTELHLNREETIWALSLPCGQW